MKLNEIQQKLVAPKGQDNAFAHFKYRSCEDILERVKPLLGDSVLTLSDEIVLIGDRYYIKASAQLRNGEKVTTVHAYAREQLSKKGMDESQITGTASSYARKYALNGLFCIDNTKDADTMDNDDKPPKVDKPPAKRKDQVDQVIIGIEGRTGWNVLRAKVEIEIKKLHKDKLPTTIESRETCIEELSQPEYEDKLKENIPDWNG